MCDMRQNGAVMQMSGASCRAQFQLWIFSYTILVELAN
jgi:hypothetical protein